MLGKKVLNFEIKSLIGEGGMGNVYLAVDETTNRTVAIKAVLPHLAKNEQIRARFINEAKTMARLQHENIVHLHEYVVNDEGLYLIMEYVDGDPLDTYLDKVGGSVEEDLAIEITLQVLRACDHAHKNGVVHRDIKPGNIVIDKNGVVKILDFGIAKIVNEEVSKLTKTGLHIGTVYYMAPEQVKGEEITFQTDIYSIGVSLYQMITMKNPYKEMTTEFQIFKKIVEEPLPDVRVLAPDSTLYINKVIQKATRKDPSKRFKNCGEFIEVLEKKNEYRERHNDQSTTRKPENATIQPETNYSKWNTTIGVFYIGAILSLIFGALAFIQAQFGILGLVFAIPAIIIGHNQYKKSLTDVKFKYVGSNAKTVRLLGVLGGALCLLAILFQISIDGFSRDSDGDGFLDKYDDCPYDYGFYDGCPDSDFDGVMDKYDNCPWTKGETDNFGCPYPDRDNDGVPDKDDLCPTKFGPSSNSGCPKKVENYNYGGAREAHFSNNTSVDEIFVAVCSWNGNSWKSEGWYSVKKGKSISCNLPSNTTDYFYYHAMGDDNVWGNASKSFCVDPINAFTYYNVSRNCANSKEFVREDIDGAVTKVNFID